MLAVQAEAAQPGRYVCLTFDDGPSKHTDAIAAALAEYHAPATFFVTAQPANLPYYDRLPALLAAGHQIAMHSASHDYAAIYQSPEAFWLDIKALRQALEPYVPLDELYWLRFPGGSTNTVSHRYGGRQIMRRLIAEAEEKGYRWIDWNVCGRGRHRRPPGRRADHTQRHRRRRRAGCLHRAAARHRRHGRDGQGPARYPRLVRSRRLPLLHGGRNVLDDRRGWVKAAENAACQARPRRGIITARRLFAQRLAGPATAF